MKLAEHPTVKRIRQQETNIVEEDTPALDAVWLRQLVLDAGADDVGFVQINRPELDDQRDDILRAFPRTKTRIIRSKTRINPSNLTPFCSKIALTSATTSTKPATTCNFLPHFCNTSATPLLPSCYTSATLLQRFPA